MHPAIPILLVFVGCCSNVVFLELIIRDVPSSGTIVTFTQFFFITIEGFVRTTKMATIKPIIPIRSYILMVILFFLTSVVNNYAFAFKISMPLHLIFRSGSLIANLVLGMILLKKSYNMTKYISVFMITIGISVATVASVGDAKSKTEDHEEDYNNLLHWIFGIIILTIALFLSALMGLYQEVVYKKYGKHPNEALFYNHALPLPFFLLFSQDLINHVHIFNQSDPFIPGFIPIPTLWVYIIGNMITQYVCIRSVFILTSECPSLTVTLVVTLRKFLSLVFSIIYFGNPFTAQHWLGTVSVFTGTFLFAELHEKLGEVFAEKVGVERKGIEKGGVSEKRMDDGGEVMKVNGVHHERSKED